MEHTAAGLSINLIRSVHLEPKRISCVVIKFLYFLYRPDQTFFFKRCWSFVQLNKFRNIDQCLMIGKNKIKTQERRTPSYRKIVEIDIKIKTIFFFKTNFINIDQRENYFILFSHAIWNTRWKIYIMFISTFLIWWPFELSRISYNVTWRIFFSRSSFDFLYFYIHAIILWKPSAEVKLRVLHSHIPYDMLMYLMIHWRWNLSTSVPNMFPSNHWKELCLRQQYKCRS